MNPPAATPPAHRIDSVDLLRGLIMVVMALDHVRDFFHFSAVQGFSPTDLGNTSVAIFFTRWITHYCAPVFSFLAGIGVYLALARGKSRAQMSWFLVSRGAWLMFLELTVLMWFGWAFEINLKLYFLATLWALGWSMIVLALLIHLPRTVVLVFSLALILGHNAFDAMKPESWGALGWLWKVLHAGGNMQTAGGVTFFAFYPLIPWIAVMSAGYCLGSVYDLPAERRRPLLWRAGLGITAAFVLLRFTNLYGDRVLWSSQSEPAFTVLSFLNTTKYPPSLCYLLMTLGPGMMLLAWFEGGIAARLRPLLVYGQVPFFYYLLHIPLIHSAAWVTNYLRFGRGDFSPLGGQPPAEAGFSLVTTYLVWIAVVAALYLPCRWFADLKRRRRDIAWLSYF